MAGSGYCGFLALLGLEPVCAGTNHEGGPGGLRGDHCFKSGLVAFAFGALRRTTLSHAGRN